MTSDIRQAARILWDYHHLNHKLGKADIIWALGSHDLRVADRAAELWKEGLAPLIVMSGGYGNFTEGVFTNSEAELFARRAVEAGVPIDRILVENQSTNTGENVTCTRSLLKKKHIPVNSVIAVQKPYMERRTYATIRAQWPELTVHVTSPKLSYPDYCTMEIPENKVIAIMVGDLHRILQYPRLGYMIEQHVPDPVLDAMQLLISAGYDSHLLT